ncbi:MAG: Kazal-type serine protease inhibitor [Myxococcales bacterium]
MIPKRSGRQGLAYVGAWLALLGAIGCVEDLSVGVERSRGAADAGQDPQDGAVIDEDAGTLPFCNANTCPEPTPQPATCENGEVHTPICTRVEDHCEWLFTECPAPSDGGAPPACGADDCEFVITFDSTGVVDEFNCADGKPPECKRDQHGFCSYQCNPEGSCSLANSDCGEGMFCVFRLGTCGHNDDTALCQPKSQLCPSLYFPVCGCDGITYPNTCEAFRAGVSIAFYGACSEDPELCDSCDAAAATTAKTLLGDTSTCDDGQHVSGPTCVKKPKGGCAYQWLQCPSPSTCGANTQLALEPGACWSNDDCDPGLQCRDASLCPCNASCFSADRPGHCE